MTGSVPDAAWGVVNEVSATWHRLRELGHDLVRRPDLRPLRWALVVALVVRLVLAPLTSWGSDTSGFVLGDVQLLYTGSPYNSELFFNPPFAPLVQAPFILLALLAASPHSLVAFVPGLVTVSEASGIASPLLPTPAALLAIKLPLILSDLAVGLLLYRLTRPLLGARAADWAALGWLLNPLVIWTSAVHGEVDTLAALSVLLTLWTLVHRQYLACGIFAALGVFAKVYPAVLLPLLLAYVWIDPNASGTPSPRTTRIGSVALGLGLGTLPFLPWLSNFATIVASTGGSPSYGGLSVVVIYNAAVPKAYAALGVVQSAHFAGPMLDVLRGLAVIAVVASPIALLLAHRRHRLEAGVAGVPLVAALACWCVVSTVLASSVPQSENLIGAVALLLLTFPVLGRTARVAYALLTAAGFGLYLTLLTPFAFFYPLAVVVGPGAVNWISHAAITYADGTGILSQGAMWLILGLLGGGTQLAIWARCCKGLLPWDWMRARVVR